MCLGVPGQVLSMIDGNEGQLVTVELSGRQVRANIGMLEDPVHVGDWVIVHMGFAMETIGADEAAEVLAGLDTMTQMHAALADFESASTTLTE